MRRKTQLLIAGAGAAAGVYGLTRLFGGKRINTLPYGYGIKMKRSVTVNAAPEQLYEFWSRLENLPALFGDLVSVRTYDDKHSHWALKVPGGMKLEWDAEITIDRKGEMIGWRSQRSASPTRSASAIARSLKKGRSLNFGGADLDNAGYVRFERATGGRGTVVRVALQYNPPAGKLGAALAALLGEKPTNLVEAALRKFKQVVEAGEIPTTTGENKQPHLVGPVETASEDSFPASDAPSWTGTTGP